MNMSINSVNPVFTSHKNSNKGAKIGAITGSVVASAWAYGALKNFDKIVKYMPNTIDMKVYKQTKVLSAAIFIVLATGIGALVGKGAQKLSEYIKSKKKENKHNIAQILKYFINLSGLFIYNVKTMQAYSN